MFRVGSRFASRLLISILVTGFLGGGALTPVFAQQPRKLSKAEQVALKHEIASCKSEAKHKRIRLRARRQYVVDCVSALENRPSIDVQKLLRNHPDLKGLPCLPNPDPGYKLAC